MIATIIDHALFFLLIFLLGIAVIGAGLFVIAMILLAIDDAETRWHDERRQK